MPNNNQNITHLPTDETLAAGLADIAAAVGSSPITVDDEMSDNSENPVQNKVVKEYIDETIVCPPFFIEFSVQGNDAVADKTFGEIKAALDSGKICIVKVNIAGVTNTTIVITQVEVIGSTYSISWADGGQHAIVSISGTENSYPAISLV